VPVRSSEVNRAVALDRAVSRCYGGDREEDAMQLGRLGVWTFLDLMSAA